MRIPLAKTIPPRLARIVSRPRLFRRLDQTRARIVFVHGPPGAGKTALAASWLAARRRRSAWLQLDTADADVASFFHYLGTAVSRFARAPAPTAEWIATPAAFARLFFRALAAPPRVRTVLVLDEYQELALDSPVHAALREGVRELPPGSLVLVLSRASPPQAFARLQSEGELEIIAPDELLLTTGEAQAIVRLRHRRGGNPKLIARSDGWAAGLVLLLEHDGAGTSGPVAPSIFDYFASEILARADGKTKQVLLASSLLDGVTGSIAARITGVERAPHILDELSRRGYFVVRLAGDQPAYRFHPLFLDFLRARAALELGATRIRELHRSAATALESAGSMEEAFESFCKADDFEGAGRMLLAQARSLHRQGRIDTLRRCLDQLPAEVTTSDPWFDYWRGVAAGLSAPAVAQEAFESAYLRFVESGNGTGAALAWAAAATVHAWALEDMAPLDTWIARLGDLERRFGFAARDEEAAVAAAAVGAFANRQRLNPHLGRWEARATDLALSIGDRRTRLALAQQLIMYDGWFAADLSRATMLLHALAPIAEAPENDPLSGILWHVGASQVHVHLGDAASALAATGRGLALGESTGCHVWDPALLTVQVWAELMREDFAAARRGLTPLAHSVRDAPRLLRLLSHNCASTVALHLRDFQAAREESRAAARLADDAGMPVGQSFVRVTWALAADMGRGEGPSLAEALRWAVQSGNVYAEHGCRLGLAAAALRRSDESGAVEHLRSALALGRHLGLMCVLWFGRADLSEMCALALEHGIEPDYVRRLIATRAIPAGERAQGLAAWPWAVRIDGAGRVACDGSVAASPPARKQQKKPLELLSLLVEAGPLGAPAETLADALWPDADGDRAQHALETAIYRLRRILGQHEALVQKEGRLVLDSRRVYVQGWSVGRDQ